MFHQRKWSSTGFVRSTGPVHSQYFQSFPVCLRRMCIPKLLGTGFYICSKFQGCYLCYSQFTYLFIYSIFIYLFTYLFTQFIYIIFVCLSYQGKRYWSCWLVIFLFISALVTLKLFSSRENKFKTVHHSLMHFKYYFGITFLFWYKPFRAFFSVGLLMSNSAFVS